MSNNFDPNQNHYIYVKKDNTPLVFIHGVGLDHQMWKPQIENLNEFSTITYELLGHGKTPCKKGKLNLTDFSNQLNEILEHLNIEKIHLVGFSLGSLIALDFASKSEDKIDKLILIGTTYKRSSEERSLVLDRYNQAKLNKPISKQALKRWFTDEYIEKHPNIYEKISSILAANNMQHFLKVYELFVKHQNDEDFNKIQNHTLVMTGEHDIGSTVKMSQELNALIPKSQLKIIKDGKHLCGIECADDVNSILNSFIKDNE